MKNKNPFLVPELREMPAAGESRTHRVLYESVNPTAGGHGLPLARLSGRVVAQFPSPLYRTASAPPNCRPDPRRFRNFNPMPGRVAP